MADLNIRLSVALYDTPDRDEDIVAEIRRVTKLGMSISDWTRETLRKGISVDRIARGER